MSERNVFGIRMKLGANCVGKRNQINGGRNGGICRSQKSGIMPFYCSSASTDAYFGSHVPSLVPPLIYISIFQNYNVLAPCGYEYHCLKAIFDDFRYHAYRLGKITIFRVTR